MRECTFLMNNGDGVRTVNGTVVVSVAHHQRRVGRLRMREGGQLRW
jgi:hypothetical protein